MKRVTVAARTAARTALTRVTVAVRTAVAKTMLARAAFAGLVWVMAAVVKLNLSGSEQAATRLRPKI